MPLNTYVGTGVTLSTNYYMRNFYASNRDAGKSSKRSEFSNHELSLEDGLALKRAVKSLGSFTYEEDNDTNIRNGVKAFISTYNNTISSLSDSSDRDLTRDLKRLKSLTKEYANDLDKVGITVNNDGTLTGRDALLGTVHLDKLEKLFSSSSDYMKHVTSYSKQIQTRADDLLNTDKMKAVSARKKTQAPTKIPDENTDADAVPNTGTTAAAQIVNASMDLNTLTNSGIGKTINLSV